ncbi:MAG: HAD superfamily hydrolase (TIGR01490 family) [Glaciecola sp.]
MVAYASGVPNEQSREATRERFGREDADRLSEDALTRIARRRTGAVGAAFFDLDKTIIARSSTMVMGRTFLKDGLISPSTILRGIYAQTVYNLVGADHGQMEKMRAAMLDLAKGWEAERVRRLVRETMAEVIGPLVYAEAMELIDEHRAAGRDVWIVSAAGEEIVVPFGEHLGIHDVLATVAGLDDDGCYDGTLDFYAYAHAKQQAIEQVARVRGYDLTQCHAYSDSVSDLPMLTAVGHPMAVNPDKELRAAAVALGWDVRNFSNPTPLRSRLPQVRMPEARPRPSILAAGGAVLATAMVAWRLLGPDD